MPLLPRSRRRRTRPRRCSLRLRNAASAGTRRRWCAGSIRPAASRCSPTTRVALRPLPRRAQAQGAAGRRASGWPSTAGSLSIRGRSRLPCPGVFAVGDVTSVGTPKAGVFAEGQRGRGRPDQRAIRGDGESEIRRARICYLEFGHHQVAKVDVTFRSGQTPPGASKDRPGARRRQGRVRLEPRAAVVQSHLALSRSHTARAVSPTRVSNDYGEVGEQLQERDAWIARVVVRPFRDRQVPTGPPLDNVIEPADRRRSLHPGIVAQPD